MNYFKSFFKISIILILLIITVGSIYAADNADSSLNVNPDDDFVLNEDMDDDFDEDDDEDDSGEDDSDDDFDEDDDEDDSDEDDSDDEDLDDEDDYNDSDVDDFEFLEFNILAYLEKYGNCTDENWTGSEDFLNEYQIYLSDPSNYTLNQSAEGYETYLKIYNSTVSTFGDYNLTENETAYLKFLIIYYLNHYGNVSANYTWNESDDFGRFHLWEFSTALEKGFALGGIYAPEESYKVVKNIDNMFSPTLATSSDLNRTGEGSNATEMPNVDTKDNGSWWTYIIILFLALAIAILVIRRV